MRRLACEADIIPIVLDGDGRVVDVGRAKRLATADQRRALRAMHQTCAAPDCPVRFGDCDIHHLNEWNDGGLTNLENLIPLCSKHHHLIHEGQMAPTSPSTRRLTGRAGAGPTQPTATDADRRDGQTPNTQTQPTPTSRALRQPSRSTAVASAPTRGKGGRTWAICGGWARAIWRR